MVNALAAIATAARRTIVPNWIERARFQRATMAHTGRIMTSPSPFHSHDSIVLTASGNDGIRVHFFGYRGALSSYRTAKTQGRFTFGHKAFSWLATRSSPAKQ